MARKTVRIDALEVRRLLIAATGGDDVIRVLPAEPSAPPRSYVVEINGQRTVETFAANVADRIVVVDCLAGNDSLTTDPSLPFRVRANGGDGNDTVLGDSRNPLGIENPDFYGADTIEGNAGNDALNGGGNNDRIFGHGGNDTLVGGGGNDTMFGGPEDADTVRGGTGNDGAAQDAKDFYESVEVMLT